MPEDQHAWQELFHSHAAALGLYARQWLPDSAAAEDAVQEGFIRCWRRGGDSSRMVPFLYVAVRSAALDMLKANRRRLHREQKVARDERQSWWSENGLVDREWAAAIQDALTRLPPEERSPVILRIWGGLTIHQAAEVLEINANTLSDRYRRALRTLASLLPDVNADET